MNSATRRLRRAGVAGLATVATVGGLIIGTGGSALAFVDATSAATAATLATSTVSLTAGASNQALSDLTLTFPANASAHEFSAGEQLTFVLSGDQNANEVSTSVFNTAAFAAAPTVSIDNGVTAPGATTALTSVDTTGGGTFSGANNAFKLTFSADAPENTNATKVTLSGLKLNLGSAIATGQTFTITATATTPSTAKPFWVGGVAASSASVDVATIPQLGLSVSKVAVGNPTAGTATLGTISIKVIDAGAAKNGDKITLSLTGATWATNPTAGGSPSATVAAGGTTADVDITLTADAKAGDTITLTGGKIEGAGAGAVTLALTSTGAVTLLPADIQVAAIVAQNRIGGADRYSTASLLFAGAATSNAGLGFSGFTGTSVVLTSGANFPDALSAQYLARSLSTAGTVGVLTTDPNTLSTSAQQQILHNGADINTVYVLGGTSAVSDNVVNQLKALHVDNDPSQAPLTVIRIGGADRYATNNLVDLYLGITGSTTAFVATGANFADALAIGPAVYATGNPLVLTDGAALSDSAKSTLVNLGITNVVIVGGTNAVSDAVKTSIESLGITVDTRLSGSDRTQTAAAVAGYEMDAGFNGGNPFDLGNVYIARGDSFADALVAGPIAALSGVGNGNPILLTSNPTTLGAGIPSVLKGQAANVDSLTALGLTAAVSVPTMTDAAASLSLP